MDHDVAERFWSKVVRGDGCWEWQACRAALGYGRIRVDGKVRIASRIAFELAVGPIPEGMLVCHHCDNPPCVNPEHLFLGDWTANARDRAHKGRNGDIRGERNIGSKLTSADVTVIRRAAATGETARSIATRYPVTPEAIHAAAVGRTWKHHPEPTVARFGQGLG